MVMVISGIVSTASHGNRALVHGQAVEAEPSVGDVPPPRHSPVGSFRRALRKDGAPHHHGRAPTQPLLRHSLSINCALYKFLFGHVRPVPVELSELVVDQVDLDVLIEGILRQPGRSSGNRLPHGHLTQWANNPFRGHRGRLADDERLQGRQARLDVQGRWEMGFDARPCNGFHGINTSCEPRTHKEVVELSRRLVGTASARGRTRRDEDRTRLLGEPRSGDLLGGVIWKSPPMTNGHSPP